MRQTIAGKGRKLRWMSAAAGLAALAASLVPALVPEASAAEPIAGAKLRSLLTGNIARGTTDGINDIVINFRPDGSMTGSARTLIFVQEDTGVWEIVGDTICMTWTSWADAERTCVHIVRRGLSFASFTSDGTQMSTFRLARNAAKPEPSELNEIATAAGDPR